MEMLERVLPRHLQIIYHINGVWIQKLLQRPSTKNNEKHMEKTHDDVKRTAKTTRKFMIFLRKPLKIMRRSMKKDPKMLEN